MIIDKSVYKIMYRYEYFTLDIIGVLIRKYLYCDMKTIKIKYYIILI